MEKYHAISTTRSFIHTFFIRKPFTLIILMYRKHPLQSLFSTLITVALTCDSLDFLLITLSRIYIHIYQGFGLTTSEQCCSLQDFFATVLCIRHKQPRTNFAKVIMILSKHILILENCCVVHCSASIIFTPTIKSPI